MTRSSDSRGVLLIRVNTRQEIWASEHLIGRLRAHFPGSPLYTLVFNSDDAIMVDPDRSRFDEILLFAAKSTAFGPSQLLLLSKFLRSQDIGHLVVSVDSDSGIDYSRQILSALLFPGKSYLLKGSGAVIPYATISAWPAIIQAFGRTLVRSFICFANRLLFVLNRQTIRRASGKQFSEADRENVKSILCLRFDQIGDLVMTLPAINALRSSFPKARIDVLVQSLNVPLLKGRADVDNIIEYNSPQYSGVGTKPHQFFERAKKIIRLRRSRYSLAIDFRGDDEARKIAFLCGAKYRLGLYPSPLYLGEPGVWAAALSHAVQPDVGGHIIDTCLSLLTGSNLIAENSGDAITYPPLALRSPSTIVLKRKFAVVHMFSRDPIKNWLTDRFVAVIGYITTALDMDVLLTGGESDRCEVEQVRQKASNSARVHNVAGELPLDALVETIATSRIMVTVDTGPMHIAAALEVPVVGLFLAEHASIFYPYGQQSRILVAGDKAIDVEFGSKNALLPLATVTAEEVINRINEVLAEVEL